MRTAFGKVGIYGVGLIGGSLGLALKARRLARCVHGIGRNAERLEKAAAAGVIDSYSVGPEGFPRDLEILVLGTPLSVYARALDEIGRFLAPSIMVTDVGSAQAAAAGEVDAHLPAGVPFVGSHPMAGAERTGFEAAEADLFQGAVCALCPSGRTSPASLRRVRELWESVGCRTVVLGAEEHDRIVGWTSHLPHVVASALTAAVADFAASQPDARHFLSSGFGDTTRIASGDPVMWRDICERNRGNLVAGLRRFQERIEAYIGGLEAGDAEGIFRLLTEGKERREDLIGNDNQEP